MSFEITFKDWPSAHGKITYGQVPWDSEIFGFPFFELRISDYFQGLSESLNEFLQHIARSSRSRCIVFLKIPTKETRIIKALTRQGFYPVETMVEIYRNLQSFSPVRSFERLRLRPATIDDTSKILSIARHAFSMDRYHLDPNLPDDKASYRYEYWLGNGLKSQDLVLIYEDVLKAKSLGFCHLRDIRPDTVDFSLGAIDPSYQKAGLGVMMYSECISLCQKRDKKQMITRISINNVAVVNIFSKLGFLFRHPMLVLHWYGDFSKETIGKVE
jgi:dTDP-4-amino-4,6-dideoxy-D-galactose acyltransferase